MIRVMHMTIRVRNQEEDQLFYLERLDFEKRADFPLGPGRRWLKVGSKDDPVLELVLQPSSQILFQVGEIRIYSFAFFYSSTI